MIKLNLDDALKELAESHRQLLISWDEANKTSIDMDGRMQTRYDTQKEEYAARANIIMSQIESNEHLVNMLKKILISEKADTITIGCCVKLQIDDDEEPLNLVLLDDLGGGSLCGFDLISVNSPLGKSIIGKRVGERINYSVANKIIGLRIIDFA